jgi:ketosteroid isomerase-like protein
VPDEDSVLAANRAFYEAFERRDLDAMSDVWEHSDRASCTHPGWAMLHGWAAIASSWYALFTNEQHLQFIVTAERAVVVGDAGWVTCDENILSDQASGTVAAVNLFVRGGDSWRMVGHHGAAVAGRDRTPD